MNLLATSATADYIDSGTGTKKTIKKAKRINSVNVTATTKTENYSRVPQQNELQLTPGAAYVHITSNNTIEGTEYKNLPTIGDMPLVNDTSSNMFSRPIDITRHTLIYSNAQKNIEPTSITVIIVHENILKRSNPSMPTILNYAIHAKNRSMYNTPPTFAIYTLDLIMKGLIGTNSLSAMATSNERKATKLYNKIDRNSFYRNTAHKNCRSLMNVTFRLASEDLEKQFIKTSTATDLDNLKGHRSIDSIRASIYNAFPEKKIDTLISFMQEFERTHG